MCIGRFRLSKVSIGAAFAVAAASMGCSLDLIPQPAESDGNETSLEGLVLIRFSNRTVEEAVDVQFYAANEPLDDLPADLFVEGNRLARSIGLAGQGIIEPGMTDSITFPCTGDLTLGTAGGKFLEAETGDERGLGTARWAQETPLGLCGSVVTFEFYREGDEYLTRFRLGD